MHPALGIACSTAVACTIAACAETAEDPFERLLSGAPVALTDFIRADTERTCRWLVNCLPVGYSTLASCRIGSPGYYPFGRWVLEKVAAGKLVYDPILAGRCLAEPLACGDSTWPSPACVGYLQGTVEPGQACELDVECASGACHRNIEFCPGTCATPGAVDTACSSTGGCGLGLVCHFGRCRLAPLPTVGVGESCANAWCGAAQQCASPEQVCVALGIAGAPCGPNNDCVYDHFCARADSGPGVCEPLRAEGQPCDHDEAPCAPDLVCVALAGLDTCLPTRELGEPCVDDAQCARFDTWCRQGTCALFPVQGEPCAYAAPVPCLLPLECEVRSGPDVCVALPDNGLPCTKDSRCSWGFGCDEGDVCRPLLGLGAVCTPEGVPCRSDLQCVAGACTSSCGR